MFIYNYVINLIFENYNFRAKVISKVKKMNIRAHSLKPFKILS